MLIPSPAVCPSADTGELSPHLSSLCGGSNPRRLCFEEAALRMSAVSRTTGQVMLSCVPGEGLLPQPQALSLMANEKVTVMDCGPCPSPAGRVHR